MRARISAEDRRWILGGVVIVILVAVTPRAILRILETGDLYLFTDQFFQDILARLPIGALWCYGFVHAGGQGSEIRGEGSAGPDLTPDPSPLTPGGGWLFLEDARGEAYLPTEASHRALATQWVGRMHMGAARIPAAARLPDRGARHYLEHLRTARETICGNVTNPALNTDDGHVLEAIVSQLNLLEARWSQVESFCDRMPGTLVHGDFVGKNMNIRTSTDGLALEKAGTRDVSRLASGELGGK